jgi:threonine dehydratase
LKGNSSSEKIGLEEINRAARLIMGTINRTPLIESSWLSEISGCQVFLKLENLQKTGSFKIRGAANKILNLPEQERARGVIAVSSGNHGRAVAYVAGKMNIPSVICISETVPENKVSAIRELGAEVVVAGSTYDEADREASKIKEQRGLTMISPFDDAHVIAGQGTIGLELLSEVPDLDSVIVPLSGGGLLGGISIAMKSTRPEIRTIGVSMDKGAAMAESLKAGRVIEVVEHPSLADALVGGLGEENRYSFNITQNYADQVLLVSEDEIAGGMIYALEKEHLLVEGGGAVGIAALLAGKASNLGQKSVVVLSGGNVDPKMLSRLINRMYNEG